MDQLSTLDILEKISEQKHTTDTDIVQLIHIYYANYIES